MKTIYLMRHGQTLFNQQKRIQGWCDSPLTDLGIQQAQKARLFFEQEGITFDKIYASTQERACDTLELVTNRTDYTRLKGLKEINFGVFEGMQEFLHLKRHDTAQSFEDVYVPYGGEDVREVGKRMHQALRDIVETESGDTFLAVSHGGAMRAFCLELKLETHLELRFPNCCIYQYTYEKGQFSLARIIDPVTETIYR